MAVLLQILLVVHVTSAMLWFGGSAFLPRELSEALERERRDARVRVAVLLRRNSLFGITATLVVVTGVGLALVVPGGFAALPLRFDLALPLALIWLAIILFGVRPAVDRIAALLASDADLAPARALAKRARRFSAILHPLFILLLVLMLWRL